MNKVKQFSSKKTLEDKLKKHNELLKIERAAQQKKMQQEKKLQQTLNQGFHMAVDSEASKAASKQNKVDSFGQLDNMANLLNSIQKQQNKGSQQKKETLSKGEMKLIKQQEEMERIQKISNMGSFNDTDFALDTIF